MAMSLAQGPLWGADPPRISYIVGATLGGAESLLDLIDNFGVVVFERGDLGWEAARIRYLAGTWVKAWEETGE